MVVRLARLATGWDKQPQLLERYWDEAMREIESTLNAILEIPIIQQAVIDAQATADAAQATADGAGTTADDSASENSLRDSYITGFTSPLIKSTTAGSVTIADHTRTYGDATLNPSVIVTGAVIASGEAIGAVLRFYYDDASRAGGAVTYAYTVDPAAPPVQAGTRHSVGVVVVPAVGTQDGNYIKPPGFINIL